MGFYGNITNVANTTFQFDKIYPNRTEMENNQISDGVMIGRYVLVEYDQKANYPIIYTREENGNIYGFFSSNKASTTKILFDPDPSSSGPEFRMGEIGQEQYEDAPTVFYKCVGKDDDGYALFKKLETKTTSENAYIQNFAIDEITYAKDEEKFNGFDSTVWVKTSKEENGRYVFKYVMIAELNSVVPTFDIAADEPTPNPIPPHFESEDTTNLHYTMHVQTPYGFRVKEATGNQKSDVETVHKIYEYNEETGELESISKKTVNAAIYYNKAGFNQKVHCRVPESLEGPENINGEIQQIDLNTIEVAPTGYSYEKEKNPYKHSTKDSGDIQELVINLPSVGNAISDVWDIVHGINRDDSVDFSQEGLGSLQGALSAFYNLEGNKIILKSSKGQLNAYPIEGDEWISSEVRQENQDTKGVFITHKEKIFDSDKKLEDDDKTLAGASDTVTLYKSVPDSCGHLNNYEITKVTFPHSFSEVVALDAYNRVTSESKASKMNDKIAFKSGGFVNPAVFCEIQELGEFPAVIIQHADFLDTGCNETQYNPEMTSETQLNFGDSFKINFHNFNRSGHIVDYYTYKYILPNLPEEISTNIIKLNGYTSKIEESKRFLTNGQDLNINLSLIEQKIANLSTLADGTELPNYTDFSGASEVQNGASGLVPAPKVGDQNKFLRGDGLWCEISSSGSGTIYEDFKGTLDGVDGASGLVPAPFVNNINSFLGSDGNWKKGLDAISAIIDSGENGDNITTGLYEGYEDSPEGELEADYPLIKESGESLTFAEWTWAIGIRAEEWDAKKKKIAEPPKIYKTKFSCKNAVSTPSNNSIYTTDSREGYFCFVFKGNISSIGDFSLIKETDTLIIDHRCEWDGLSANNKEMYEQQETQYLNTICAGFVEAIDGGIYFYIPDDCGYTQEQIKEMNIPITIVAISDPSKS